MSHIVTIEAEFKDLDALRAAARRLGGELHEGQTSYRWYGRWVGDTPLPAGLKKADLGKCDHAMGFPGCKYEIGIVRKESGQFELRWDYWSGDNLVAHLGGEKAPRLVQAYQTEVAIRELRRKGYVVTETKLPNGAIKIDARA